MKTQWQVKFAWGGTRKALGSNRDITFTEARWLSAILDMLVDDLQLHSQMGISGQAHAVGWVVSVGLRELGFNVFPEVKTIFNDDKLAKKELVNLLFKVEQIGWWQVAKKRGEY